MNSKLKMLASAAGVAALALTVLSSTAPASAQTHQRGSVYGPLYNPSYNPPYTFNNGTGTVPDSARDPHNDR